MTSNSNRQQLGLNQIKNNQGKQYQAEKSNYVLNKQTRARRLYVLAFCILTSCMEYFFLLKHFRFTPRFSWFWKSHALIIALGCPLVAWWDSSFWSVIWICFDLSGLPQEFWPFLYVTNINSKFSEHEQTTHNYSSFSIPCKDFRQ